MSIVTKKEIQDAIQETRNRLKADIRRHILNHAINNDPECQRLAKLEREAGLEAEKIDNPLVEV